MTEHRRQVRLATLAVMCGLVSCVFPVRRYRLVHGPVDWIGNANQPEQFRPEGNGQRSGFAVRLMQEAWRRSGVKLEWVYAPEGADEALLNGRVTKGLLHRYLAGRLFPGAELVSFDGDRELLVARPHLDPVSSPDLLISIAANDCGLRRRMRCETVWTIRSRAANRWLWLGVAGLGVLLPFTIRVGRQVAAANQKLRQSVAFVANMSHEL